MGSLDCYMDNLLTRGQAHFSKKEALKTLDQSSEAFAAAARRLRKKGRLASPKRGFFLVLRPEDKVTGAPDPARWIDPLMKYLTADYRISLLRAAAFHGSSHQAAMVFQVVAPKQLRSFNIGRHKIQFVYQIPQTFKKTNQAEWLGQIKTGAGFAKIAGVELTLLDSIRYYHKAAGINGVAQIVHDIGVQANPYKLAKAAAAYENSAVRRLGYLLDHFGHHRQAKALAPYTRKAKSMKSLDPSIKSLIEDLNVPEENDSKWMLTINEPVEIDF